jgi:hypothetical protein
VIVEVYFSTYHRAKINLAWEAINFTCYIFKMRADGFSKQYDPKDHMPLAALIHEGIIKREYMFRRPVGATCGKQWTEPLRIHDRKINKSKCANTFFNGK